MPGQDRNYGPVDFITVRQAFSLRKPAALQLCFLLALPGCLC